MKVRKGKVGENNKSSRRRATKAAVGHLVEIEKKGVNKAAAVALLSV